MINFVWIHYEHIMFIMILCHPTMLKFFFFYYYYYFYFWGECLISWCWKSGNTKDLELYKFWLICDSIKKNLKKLIRGFWYIVIFFFFETITTIHFHISHKNNQNFIFCYLNFLLEKLHYIKLIIMPNAYRKYSWNIFKFV